MLHLLHTCAESINAGAAHLPAAGGAGIQVWVWKRSSATTLVCQDFCVSSTSHELTEKLSCHGQISVRDASASQREEQLPDRWAQPSAAPRMGKRMWRLLLTCASLVMF